MILKLRQRLGQVAYRQMGELAEDLVQETLFLFFDNVHKAKYRGGDSYPEYFCYALGILKVVIIKEIRKRQQERSRNVADGPDLLEERILQVMEVSTEQRLLDHERDHWEGLAANQAKEAFQTLPDHLQELVHLHVVQGWSYSHLSEHFGIPKQTLVSRFNTCMEKLRKKMKKIHTNAPPEYLTGRTTESGI